MWPLMVVAAATSLASTRVECGNPLVVDLYNVRPYSPQGWPGEPLFVTPYIRSANERLMHKARKLASVAPFVGNIKSYAAYITCDDLYNQNLFFWFFESEKSPTRDPLVLWLHGGPGHSSLMGLFGENGPYAVLPNGTVQYRETSWTKRYNVLYVDSPVGAGYSFTDYAAGYSRTVRETGSNLYETLRQFFQLFPAYKRSPLYLTGQSYAGKYIPALASIIHDKNNDADVDLKMNLKGLFIGCGFIDPATQIHYADLLHQHGAVDRTLRDTVEYHENEAKRLIKLGHYYWASYHMVRIGFTMYGAGYRSSFIDVADPAYDMSEYDRIERFVQKDDTRRAIHVGRNAFHDKKWVVWYFREDFYSSVSADLSTLLDHYKVLLYSGEFDMIIPPVQTQKVISNLSWKGTEAFTRAKRLEWMVDGEPAGYKKSHANLTHVLVREANHIIVRCQPKWLGNLIDRFVSETL